MCLAETNREVRHHGFPVQAAVGVIFVASLWPPSTELPFGHNVVRFPISSSTGDRVLEDLVSLVFGNTAPDAIRFPESQRVLQAVHDDGALGTESFGVLLAPPPFETAFTVGVEEHRGVCSAAPGRHLPTPSLSVSDDRRSRCG
jgi:hypothetical protein